MSATASSSAIPRPKVLSEGVGRVRPTWGSPCERGADARHGFIELLLDELGFDS
jgi:hypothetical protein